MDGDRPSLVRSSGNILLRRLSVADQSLLQGHTREVTADYGATIIEARQPAEAVFFPTRGMASLQEPGGAGRAVEIALVGREGLLGWSALLGSPTSPHAAVVCTGGGTLLRIEVEPLRRACDRSRTLASAMLRFVNVVMLQMARALASQLEDALDRRIARWLLMRHDRVGGDLLLVHHEEMAASLCVRRASITDQLHLLEGLRLIRCTRGRVVIRDRAQLELFAGDAYGIAEAQYRAEIAPFGKSVAGHVASPAPIPVAPPIPLGA